IERSSAARATTSRRTEYMGSPGGRAAKRLRKFNERARRQSRLSINRYPLSRYGARAAIPPGVPGPPEVPAGPRSIGCRPGAPAAGWPGMEVTVLGAGIVGLTSAVRLAEAGHRVRVVAAATGTDTTSAVAAALWYPYRAAPRDKVTAWSAQTL